MYKQNRKYYLRTLSFLYDLEVSIITNTLPFYGTNKETIDINAIVSLQSIPSVFIVKQEFPNYAIDLF